MRSPYTFIFEQIRCSGHICTFFYLGVAWKNPYLWTISFCYHTVVGMKRIDHG